MSSTYKTISDLFATIAGLAPGLNYGKGTLEELNASSKNFPLCWWVLPVEPTESATNNDTAVREEWPIVMRFVDSGRLATDTTDSDVMYSTAKAYGDGFVYKLKDDESVEGISNVFKRQLIKQADDVMNGWEYRFTLTVYPDVDYCCALYE